MDKTPIYLDLFSGIGGFGAAAYACGFRATGFCEIESFPQQVIAARFLADTDKRSGLGEPEHAQLQGASGDQSGGRGARGRRDGKALANSKRARRDGSAAAVWEDHVRETRKLDQAPESRESVNASSFTRCYNDIRDIDGRRLRGTDLVTGGFPCQPFSVAGKRGGTSDDRDLWPEMFRVTRELAEANREIGKSTWMLGENVAGLESMEFQRHAIEVGSQNALWDDAQEVHIHCESTLLLDARIRKDLESAGFEVRFFVIPACAVDAKHRRNRLWIVAHAQCDGRARRSRRGSVAKAAGKKPTRPNDAFDSAGTGGAPAAGTDVSNASGRNGRPRRSRGSQHGSERSSQSIGSHQQEDVGNAGRTGSQGFGCEHQLREGGEEIQAVGSGDVDNPEGVDPRGLPVGAAPPDAGSGIIGQTPEAGLGTEYCRWQDESDWFAESGMGRVADGVPNRVDRLKGLGNAIVPPLAYEILRCVRQLI